MVKEYNYNQRAMAEVAQATISKCQVDYGDPQELYQRRLEEGAIGTLKIYHRRRTVGIYLSIPRLVSFALRREIGVEFPFLSNEKYSEDESANEEERKKPSHKLTSLRVN